MKTITTISIDVDVKERAKEIIEKELDMTFSKFINTKLKELIKKYERR